MILGATQLPDGVLPEWVTLASGPRGWALTPTADGHEVTGPHRVGVPTVVRYGDGSEEAWIQVPTAGNVEPGSPAPAVTVAPSGAGGRGRRDGAEGRG